MSKDKLTIQELTDLIAQRAGVSKKIAEDFLKAFFLTIEDSLLADDFVKIKNFGTFKKQWNEARKSINVRTGEEIQIEGFNKVVFTPDNSLKELVNEPYAHLEPLQLDDDVVEIKTEPVEETFSPLHIFTEQASEIKDILSEINALSALHSISEQKTDIQNDDLVLPVENVQDYLETESLVGNIESEAIVDELVEVETEAVKNEGEIVESVHNDELEAVEEEVTNSEIIDTVSVEENTELLHNDELIAVDEEVAKSENEDTKSDDDNTELVHNDELEAIEDEVIKTQIEDAKSDNEFVEVNENKDIIEEVDSELSEISEIDKTDISIDNKLNGSLSFDRNQLKKTEFSDEKPKKKKGCLITFIVVFAIITAFIINYYLSSATRCWIKYTLLSEENLEKASNLGTTASDWFTDVKSWFDKKPTAEIKENINPKIAPTPVETLEETSASDTVLITQNRVISINGKLAIDTVELKPKSVEKVDSLKQLFDGPRVYKTFFGTEKINEGSRLTLISLKYYGLRDFWVYIYEANQSLIKDPDRIPLGTLIKIPKLDSRLIDKNNPRCVQKAKELHDLYVGKK